MGVKGIRSAPAARVSVHTRGGVLASALERGSFIETRVPDGDRPQGSEAPALSVITVTHNLAPFLGALLDSLEGERASLSFEVIVVDNVSDDESAAIAGRRPW